MKHLFTFLAVCTLLASCTGMNQAECLNANWELIGMQDGSYGREISYANRHQEDCAKHGTQVDMDAYRMGHAEGVRTYCRAENGFKQGRSGRDYAGICPSDLESAFLDEYEIGREFYFLDKEISELRSSISSNLNKIEDLDREIEYLAELAVQLDISREQRNRYQDEMKAIQFEILDLQALVGEMQLLLEEKEWERNELTAYYER